MCEIKEKLTYTMCFTLIATYISYLRNGPTHLQKADVISHSIKNRPNHVSNKKKKFHLGEEMSLIYSQLKELYNSMMD